MAVTIRIPTQLRQLTGGTGEIEVEAATIASAISRLYVWAITPEPFQNLKSGSFCSKDPPVTMLSPHGP